MFAGAKAGVAVEGRGALGTSAWLEDDAPLAGEDEAVPAVTARAVTVEAGGVGGLDAGLAQPASRIPAATRASTPQDRCTRANERCGLGGRLRADGATLVPLAGGAVSPATRWNHGIGRATRVTSASISTQRARVNAIATPATSPAPRHPVADAQGRCGR